MILFIVSCLLFFWGFYDWLEGCNASECIGHAGSIAMQMLNVYAHDQYDRDPSLAIAALFALLFLLVCFSANVLLCILRMSTTISGEVAMCMFRHPFAVGGTTGFFLFFVQLYSFFETDHEYRSSHLNCTITCPDINAKQDSSGVLIWSGIVASGLLLSINTILAARFLRG